MARPTMSTVVGDLHEVARQAARAAVAEVDTAAMPDLVRELDSSVLLGIGAFLGSSTGLRHDRCTAAEIIADLRTAPRHEWIPHHWLTALTAGGLIDRDLQGRFGRSRPIRRSELVGAREAIGRTVHGLGYPDRLAHYLLDTLRHLESLLRDEVSAQSLLFPDGDLATAQAVYHDNPINRYLNAAAIEVARWATHRCPDRLRVLELGAGIGATTADLLPVLSGHTMEYLFTDLSEFFLQTARWRFAQHRFVRYHLVDFDADIPQQVPDARQVELVVAVNTAHNALHVGELLTRIRSLLTPGGALLLIETTEEHHQSLTSMPFLLSARPGRPHPERRDHRAGTSRTYHTGAEWLAELRLADLNPVVLLPEPQDPLAAFSQHLVLALA